MRRLLALLIFGGVPVLLGALMWKSLHEPDDAVVRARRSLGSADSVCLKVAMAGSNGAAIVESGETIVSEPRFTFESGAVYRMRVVLPDAKHRFVTVNDVTPVASCSHK